MFGVVNIIFTLLRWMGVFCNFSLFFFKFYWFVKELSLRLILIFFTLLGLLTTDFKFVKLEFCFKSVGVLLLSSYSPYPFDPFWRLRGDLCEEVPDSRFALNCCQSLASFSKLVLISPIRADLSVWFGVLLIVWKLLIAICLNTLFIASIKLS